MVEKGRDGEKGGLEIQAGMKYREDLGVMVKHSTVEYVQ